MRVCVRNVRCVGDYNETDVYRWLYWPVLARRCSVIFGCKIDFPDLGVGITQRPSILKSNIYHWPVTCATGNELFVQIKGKVRP